MQMRSSTPIEALAALARDLFDVDAVAAPLPGERHRNARLDVGGRPAYLLKVYASDCGADDGADDEPELQDAVLAHLAGRGLPVPSLAGSATARIDGREHQVRLLNWVDGRVWASAGPPDARRLAGLGAAVARLDAALAGFEHPALDREYRWHPLRATALARVLPLLDDRDREFVGSSLGRLDELAPELRALPAQAVHNDASENNVLVGADGRVAGIIDFGDVVRAPRICGLAVAVAYAQLGVPDPVAAAAAVVAGYHAEAPLTAAELRLLPDLVDIRLAMSIANAAEQRLVDPDNAYLDVSQEPIRALLAALGDQPRELLAARFRDACGYRPVANERAVVSWLRSVGCDPAPMLRTDPRTARIHHVDWTEDGPEELRMSHGPERVAAAIESRMRAGGDTLAVGRYREDRVVYQGDAFGPGNGYGGHGNENGNGGNGNGGNGNGGNGNGGGPGERRSVHLGIDLFADAGEPVFAPFDGVLAAVDFRDRDYDYGGVLMLEHRTADGTPFWLLVGHLSERSCAELRPGARVRRGERIGRVGAAAENGAWPPHIHVQLFTTLLGRSTDLPGAVRPSELDVWESVSPDPNLLLRAPLTPAAAPDRTAAQITAQITARRAANLSATLSLSYAEPLHIVAGAGAELVDAHGRRHLDLVNNVCHVGHCHPRVVEALSTQAGLLNTNTRYLHPNITEYARRLAATFPDPLNVVMLTNSGSEANDLALRLARTATGREHVLVLDWAYHGNLGSLIEISPYKFNRAGGSGPGGRVRVCALPDPYRGEFGGDGPRYAEDVAAHCSELAASGTPAAAFVHESIPGCAGQVELAGGYLQAAYAHARAAGALCIADEVQCGFGRVGTHMWAFERHGVVPDIVTLGKPIGNGHPIGAVVTTPRVARVFRTGMEYFNTYGGNPVSCAVGLAVLDVVHDQRLMANCALVGERLEARLAAMASRYPVIGDVRGRGLFLGVDLVTDRASKRPDPVTAARVVEAAKRDGVLLSTDGPADNVLKIKPPAVLTVEQAERAATVIESALAELSPRR
ncbi:aminotransferase class III-fold pyridoxal phosphate-dependent enzyme [Pseudonocardia acaciae]|uniref:aminotransferase class III-fold pyridoxal phosphate-dependent enzyme n=1 Tax=Pseudonocardia acaciae TaxID=551276 RepID=UPI00055C0126|nr:aminotransferase class III-fold pyridoxal phosphate-dependent enzyme [Pseudonocardia acaciae]